MARIVRDITLKHQANVEEDVEDVSFRAGEQVKLLKEWTHTYLCKSESGLLFNIPKEYVEAED